MKAKILIFVLLFVVVFGFGCSIELTEQERQSLRYRQLRRQQQMQNMRLNQLEFDTSMMQLNNALERRW